MAWPERHDCQSLVPTARLELAQLSPLPPQDSVSTNFTTSAGSELSGSRGMVCAFSTTVRVYPESRMLFGTTSLFHTEKDLYRSAISHQLGCTACEEISPQLRHLNHFAGICASPVAGVGTDAGVGASAAGATAASEPAGICCVAGRVTSGKSLVFSSTLPDDGAEPRLPK